MAASAADVRSILSLPSPSTSTPQPKKPKENQSTRKPEGISRELYSLIGDSAPSLAAQLAAKPRLKQKPNFGSRNAVKWEWRAFKNPARSDGLELRHWVRANTDPTAEYPFAKYNVEATVYTYSQDEYVRFLEDNEWTKEETDYLFDIVREYDIRWYVIHDRYNYPNGVPRMLEDLKDRYYSVCRKLIRNRSWSGDEASRAQLLSSFQFDKDRELTRKKYIASLENRTPDQIAEEEALYIELKRLEQNERKFKKEREDLLRILAGIDSGLPDIVEDESPFMPMIGAVGDIKKKKKGVSASVGSMDVDSPATPSNVISLGPPIVKKPPTAKSAAYDQQHCIIRTDPPTTSATKAAHQPAYLRSFKIPFPKAAFAPKINQVFAELGINPNRLVMPTRENFALFESLLEGVTSLVETKKVMDRVEYDIRTARERLGLRASAENEKEKEDRSGEMTKEEDGMDVDGGEDREDADGEEEDGRAHSVVSTRSTRSRRQARRSMSISSADTSATVSTRPSTKRQKRG